MMTRVSTSRPGGRAISILAALLVALAAILVAAPGDPASAQSFPVESFTLENGLQILLQPDRTVPSLCLAIVYRTGGKNERPGITGISHLFEHMMFNGSAKYPPKQFDQILEAGGGYSNAYTTEDMTLYYDEFNPELLVQVLDMEADRMRSLKIDSENLEQERGIVMEERRVRVENSPRRRLYEELKAVAFDAHPYGNPVLGWMTDLEQISVADCQGYFQTYYAPNNAVLCLAGDFEPKAVRPLIEAAFNEIPRQAQPTPVAESEEPQLGERYLEVVLPAEQAAVIAAYHMVGRQHADYLAYDLLSNVLGFGESSRLHQSLVYDSEVASSATAFIDGTEHPGLLFIWADVNPGKTSEEVLAAVDSVAAKILTEGVTDAEIEKARNQALSSHVRGLTTNQNRAEELLTYAALEGDHRRLFNVFEAYDQVTAEDVNRVAHECLASTNRTVAVLVPEEES
jgi:predicted Zn-dependent peptidase